MRTRIVVGGLVAGGLAVQLVGAGSADALPDTVVVTVLGEDQAPVDLQPPQGTPLDVLALPPSTGVGDVVRVTLK